MLRKGTSTLCRAAKIAPCHKYMRTLRRLGCGMPFDAARPKNSIGKLLVPSKEAVRHMMNERFQNGISQFEKKIRPTSPISFHSFGNLKKVCQKFFFHVDAITLVAYTEQLLPRGKAAVCCILLRGIVWTHLNAGKACILREGDYIEGLQCNFSLKIISLFLQVTEQNFWDNPRIYISRKSVCKSTLHVSASKKFF